MPSVNNAGPFVLVSSYAALRGASGSSPGGAMAGAKAPAAFFKGPWFGSLPQVLDGACTES